MLSPMTKDSQWISSDQAVSSMAYFAQTGPFGTVCSKCIHYVSDGSANERRCSKYREMLKAWGAKIRKRQPSCKYFEPKPPAPKQQR
jgi:hypothetical protein